MVSSFSIAVLLASLSTLLVRAEVAPLTPSPGAVFNEGADCKITWSGDTNSTTTWKDMAIELMTGNNYEMVFLTTVTTGQDGTKDGSFTWKCPAVKPNSAIYFYQFVSPLSTNTQWTTRFTIASTTGATTDPTNDTQPNGDKISWGTGALADASSASAAPAFASSATSSALPSSSSAASSSSSPSSSARSSMTTVVRSTAGAGNTAGAAGATSIVSDPTGTSGANNAAASNKNAAPMLAVDYKVWQTAFGVVSSAMALALFL